MYTTFTHYLSKRQYKINQKYVNSFILSNLQYIFCEINKTTKSQECEKQNHTVKLIKRLISTWAIDDYENKIFLFLSNQNNNAQIN